MRLKQRFKLPSLFGKSRACSLNQKNIQDADQNASDNVPSVSSSSSSTKKFRLKERIFRSVHESTSRK